MKHIRFMNDSETICNNPKRLDLFDSPVIVDFDPADAQDCRECNAALMAHNKGVYEDEMTYSHNFHLNRENPLAPARGCMYGLLIASVFWLIVGMIIWAVWF